MARPIALSLQSAPLALMDRIADFGLVNFDRRTRSGPGLRQLVAQKIVRLKYCAFPHPVPPRDPMIRDRASMPFLRVQRESRSSPSLPNQAVDRWPCVAHDSGP